MQDPEQIQELVQKLVKAYDLDAADREFILWYAQLDKAQREAIFPVMSAAMLKSAADILNNRKKRK